jgi:ABC-2 type transport system permease protein
MLRIALRLHRTAWLSMSALGAFYGALQAITYPLVVGSSLLDRARFGQQMAALGRQISYLAPLPVRADTLGGYLQWRMYGAFLPIAFGFWAFMAGSGVIRGDEERGVLEHWLASGVARGRLIGIRFLAYLLVATAAIALTSIAAGLGSVIAGEPLDAGALALASVPVVGLMLACFGVGLVTGQLSGTRRGAAGLAGGILLALFLINSLSRTAPALEPYRVVSPFFYYDHGGAVLVPGGTFNLGATLVLFAMALALAGVAATAFIRRDLGSPLFRRRARTDPPSLTPAANPLLRLPVVRDVYEQRIALTAWLIGVAAMAVLFASIARPTVDLMRSTPGLQAYLAVIGGGNPYQAMIGFFWFGTLQLLLAVYVITHVARWSADEAEGRLEVVLSEPMPRWRVVAERAVAVALTTACLVAAGTIAAAVVARTQQITLDPGALLEAAALLLPFALAFGTLGAMLAAFVPRAAVGILAAYAVAGYLLQQFGLLLKWPTPILDLSVFQLYGAPLVTGVYWTGLWVLLAITGVGFSAALLLMQRRDIGR